MEGKGKDDTSRQASHFLQVIAQHQGEMLPKWRKYMSDSGYPLTDDVFQDTILRVYDIIQRKGISARKDTEYLDYFFKALRNNTLRETQYTWNSRKDTNTDASQLADTLDNGEETLEEKGRREYFHDYCQMRILDYVERNFDPLTLNLFRYYTLIKGMTYKRLRELTQVRKCKDMVLEVKRRIREELPMRTLRREFNEWYDTNIDG